jgi:myosin heavy subunit
MKAILAALSVLLILSGCNVDKRNIKRQHAYNYQYKDETAKDCATLFPVIETTVETKKADNKDYTGKIDSLQAKADSLKNLATSLSHVPNNHADSLRYVQQTNVLHNKINSLQSAISVIKSEYKPCKPDTVLKKVVDVALLKVWQNKYQGKADSLIKVQTKLEAADKKASKFELWFWLLVGIEAAGIIIYVVIKIYAFANGGGIASSIKKII